ncbi:MAG: DUF2800 domain-containing protein [Muribaculaceae bacterium]|nr:DUF2800 domain-containing protein [Muribaculaceae bacterium]
MSHALLSPSGAHIWLHCTPAVRAAEHLPNPPNAYTEEGTLAHAMAARALKLRYMPGHDIKGEEDEIRRYWSKYGSSTMWAYTGMYTGYIDGLVARARRAAGGCRVLVEQPLDLREWVPEAYGTGDCVILSDGRLDIVDLKYGRGVKVEAPQNPQLMLYGLGALGIMPLHYDIETVSMHIVQPRRLNISTYTVSRRELLLWAGGTLKPRALLAWRGEGDRQAGEWCRFCMAKTDCKAYSALAGQNRRNGFNEYDFRDLTDLIQ